MERHLFTCQIKISCENISLTVMNVYVSISSLALRIHQIQWHCESEDCLLDEENDPTKIFGFGTIPSFVTLISCTTENLIILLK